MRIEVKVKAPRVILPEVAERTLEPRILLQGRIEPYFEGLAVKLENLGQGAFWLSLARSVGGSAAFSREVDLTPNEENTIRIECFYRDKPLSSPPVQLSVFCDRRPPVLDLVRCEPLEDFLAITLHPSEQLRELRIQEVVGKEGRGEWRVVEPDILSLVYKHVIPLPVRPTTFRVEMTDLAGNHEVADAYCSGASLAYERAETFSAERGSALEPSAAKSPPAEASRSLEEQGSRIVPAVHGPTFIRSEFVRDMGMDFVPFGHERLEVSRTEVSERTWFLFLTEKGLGAYPGGRAQYPMTLGETAPGLLREFVKWFEESARDGYWYSIPTRDQWISAFTGMSDIDGAKKAMAEWFQRSFIEPGERYGWNKTYPIGSRGENKTPTGLLDMESNVQEIVVEGEVFKVIGGSNRTSVSQLLEQCLHSRPYGTDEQTLQGRVTGFRLCRRPALAR